MGSEGNVGQCLLSNDLLFNVALQENSEQIKMAASQQPWDPRGA